jgi:hypothetical protein
MSLFIVRAGFAQPFKDHFYLEAGEVATDLRADPFKMWFDPIAKDPGTYAIECGQFFGVEGLDGLGKKVFHDSLF